MRRTQCEICNSENLEPFHTLKQFPVRIGVSDESSGYTYLDLQYVECQFCKNVQIYYLPDLTEVYAANHNINVIGGTWKDHNNKFATFVSYSLSNNTVILEIGDPSAKIASLVLEKNAIQQWNIIEPNPNGINIPNLKFITSFFDTNFTTDVKYDALVMSHLFEHLIGLKDLFPVMSRVLKDDGIIIISVPNLQHILNKGSMVPSGINFEHTYYFNKVIIENLFKHYKFQLVQYEKFKDHSEFFCFSKSSSKKINFENMNNDDVRNKILRTFREKQKKLDNFNETLFDKKYDGIFMYGAHVQTQMFTCMGFNKEQITGVLDNDVSKQGKYVYGNGLSVFAPEELRRFQKPLIFCDMGPYTHEITEQILEINPRAKIL